MPHLIYKIACREAWEAAQAAQRYEGSADDARDGFIHFSSAQQLAGTLAKFFAGQEGLVLVAVDGDRLGEALKWEPSRGGELFPHLYGPLPMEAVTGVADLPVDAQGGHDVAGALQRLDEAKKAAHGTPEAPEESLDEGSLDEGGLHEGASKTPQGLAP